MGLAILSEPDEDEEAYDHEHLPPPIVAARYIRAHSPLNVEAVIKGTRDLYGAYDLVVEEQYKASRQGCARRVGRAAA